MSQMNNGTGANREEKRDYRRLFIDSMIEIGVGPKTAKRLSGLARPYAFEYFVSDKKAVTAKQKRADQKFDEYLFEENQSRTLKINQKDINKHGKLIAELVKAGVAYSGISTMRIKESAEQISVKETKTFAENLAIARSENDLEWNPIPMNASTTIKNIIN